MRERCTETPSQASTKSLIHPFPGVWLRGSAGILLCDFKGPCGEERAGLTWKEPKCGLQAAAAFLSDSGHFSPDGLPVSHVFAQQMFSTLTPLSGLMIWHCRELQGRLQTWHRSCMAMAVVSAGSCSCDWTPRLGTSICRNCSAKKEEKKIVLITDWSECYNGSKQSTKAGDDAGVASLNRVVRTVFLKSRTLTAPAMVETGGHSCR